MRKWWAVIGAVLLVVGTAIAVAIALPGDLVIPDGPTSSPVPTMTTENWLDPAFSWRAGIIVISAIITMTVIALVARALDRHRSR